MGLYQISYNTNINVPETRFLIKFSLCWEFNFSILNSQFSILNSADTNGHNITCDFYKGVELLLAIKKFSLLSNLVCAGNLTSEFSILNSQFSILL